jgi:hypothetical protein
MILEEKSEEGCHGPEGLGQEKKGEYFEITTYYSYAHVSLPSVDRGGLGTSMVRFGSHP